MVVLGLVNTDVPAFSDTSYSDTLVKSKIALLILFNKLFIIMSGSN